MKKSRQSFENLFIKVIFLIGQWARIWTKNLAMPCLILFLINLGNPSVVGSTVLPPSSCLLRTSERELMGKLEIWLGKDWNRIAGDEHGL